MVCTFYFQARYNFYLLINARKKNRFYCSSFLLCMQEAFQAFYLVGFFKTSTLVFLNNLSGFYGKILMLRCFLLKVF